MHARYVLPLAVLTLALGTVAGCAAPPAEDVEQQEGAIGRGPETSALVVNDLIGTYEAKTGEVLVIRRQADHLVFAITDGGRTADFATSKDFDVTAPLPSSIDGAAPFSSATFFLKGSDEIAASWNYKRSDRDSRWDGEASFVKK